MKYLCVLALVFASLSSFSAIKCDKEAAEAARAQSQIEWSPEDDELVGIERIKYLETVEMTSGKYKTFHITISDSAGAQLWHVMTSNKSCEILNLVQVRHD